MKLACLLIAALLFSSCAPVLSLARVQASPGEYILTATPQDEFTQVDVIAAPPQSMTLLIAHFVAVSEPDNQLAHNDPNCELIQTDIVCTVKDSPRGYRFFISGKFKLNTEVTLRDSLLIYVDSLTPF